MLIFVSVECSKGILTRVGSDQDRGLLRRHGSTHSRAGGEEGDEGEGGSLVEEHLEVLEL